MIFANRCEPHVTPGEPHVFSPATALNRTESALNRT